VSQKNVSEAIRLVLKGLTGTEVEGTGTLPSYSMQNNMCTEMKLLAKQQVVEAVRDAENMTLKYDGTTKRVGHLAETEIATDSQSLLADICLQRGGTADEYVKSV